MVDWVVDPNVALASTHLKHKHAALIFHDGTLIASANNCGSDHAEWRAIQIAKLKGFRKIKDVHNLILISIAVNKQGKLKLAKPCNDCMYFLGEYGFVPKQIYYSTNNQTIVRL